MEVIINFKVRNPEWFWCKEEMQKKNDFRPLFEMVYEDKMEKHIPAWGYGLPFDVIEIKDNRDALFPLEFDVKGKRIVYELSDCTHVQFIGKENKVDAIVCNSLLHQYLAARKEGSKHYIYFFIKEDVKYERLGDLIFLNEEEASKIDALLISEGAV